jgi:hypothetical protein
VAHLERIVEVCNRTPDTKHWLPTRELHILRTWLEAGGIVPPNLCVRVSAICVDTKPPRYKLPVVLSTSTVHTDHSKKSTKGNLVCQAPTRNGECGPCRACWSPNVANVSYGAH